MFFRGSEDESSVDEDADDVEERKACDTTNPGPNLSPPEK